MDKTYAESVGHRSFDWNKALDEMIELSIRDKANDLYFKAQQWTTCACGNQCAIIPRCKAGRPLDHFLDELGVCFMDEIGNWNWTKAKSILREIEKRSTYLIKKELAKLNKNSLTRKHKSNRRNENQLA